MHVSLRLATGWRIPFIVPPAPLAAAVLLAAAVSALAGYVPARAAARLEHGFAAWTDHERPPDRRCPHGLPRVPQGNRTGARAQRGVL